MSTGTWIPIELEEWKVEGNCKVSAKGREASQSRQVGGKDSGGMTRGAVQGGAFENGWKSS